MNQDAQIALMMRIERTRRKYLKKVFHAEIVENPIVEHTNQEIPYVRINLGHRGKTGMEFFETLSGFLLPEKLDSYKKALKDGKHLVIVVIAINANKSIMAVILERREQLIGIGGAHPQVWICDGQYMTEVASHDRVPLEP
ncbi:MAG: hypothetical protein NT137_03685 [Methanomassiliicoccales archaeon]|nr:hypothetical protein [Methanomassiliicoccales archaeon]